MNQITSRLQRLSIAAAVALISGMALATELPQDLAPRTWAKRLSNEEGVAFFPRRLLVIHSIDARGRVTLPSLDVQAWSQLSYFELIAPARVRLATKLNPPRSPLTSQPSQLQHVQRLFKPDLMVIAEPGQWRLAQVSKVVTELATAAPGPLTVTGIHQWLRSALGYDGVVLAVEGEYALVATSSGLEASRQGVLISGGQGVSVPPRPVKAEAIVEILAADGTFATIHGIFPNTEAPQGLVPGAKVQFPPYSLSAEQP